MDDDYSFNCDWLGYDLFGIGDSIYWKKQEIVPIRLHKRRRIGQSCRKEIADMTDRDPRPTREEETREQTAPAIVESEMQPPPPSAKSEKNLGKSMLMKVALASVLVASLVISIANLMKANQLRDQTDEYQAEIRDYKEKIARLKYYINKDVDDEYIIEYAREYLDMYFPDEEIYYNDVNE